MVQVIETDETGRLMLSPELLGEVRPHSRYTVETAGNRLIVERETGEARANAPKLTPEEWLQQWQELAEDVGKVWPKGLSAADVISEMRRRC